MPKVLITRRLPAAGLERLAADPSLELLVSPHDFDLSAGQLLEMSAGCLALGTVMRNRIDAPFLEARPEVRLVANFAVGVDNIDLAACRARGVRVSNTPGVLTEATAEMTMALLLAVMRRVAEGDRLVRTGDWQGVSPQFMLGSGLAGKTLGIYGLGRIGLAVARRAQAFGMSIIYHNRTPRPEAEAELQARYVSFDQLLAQADVISINAPLSEQTRHAFDHQALSRMRPDAYLINTGRGPIVKESDLARALKEGLIAGAGLDVYENEPQVHRDLLGLENVVLAPHLGSATLETRSAMSLLVAENILAFVHGRELPNPVI